MYLLAIWMCLGKFYSGFLPTLKLHYLWVFLHLNCIISLYILDSYLCQMYRLYIFSHSMFAFTFFFFLCCQKLFAAAAAKSLRPHRQKPTRLPCPWDSPGKNTGVGCHFLLQRMKVKSESEVAQSSLAPSDPMDCRLLGSSVHGIFQARVLEWGAVVLV